MHFLLACFFTLLHVRITTSGIIPSSTTDGWTDDGKWPPRQLHDVTAPSAIWYNDTCPQKNVHRSFGSENPVACPPNPDNEDTLGSPPPPPAQMLWNNRQVPPIAPPPPPQGALAPPALVPEMRAFPYHKESQHSMPVDSIVEHSTAPCNTLSEAGVPMQRHCTQRRHSFTGSTLQVPSRLTEKLSLSQSPQAPNCFKGCTFNSFPHMVLEGFTAEVGKACYTKEKARSVCISLSGCGGITKEYNNCGGTHWTVRSGVTPLRGTTPQDTAYHLATGYRHVTCNAESEVKQCDNEVSCHCDSTTCQDNQDVKAAPTGMATAYNHPTHDPHGRALFTDPRQVLPNLVVEATSESWGPRGA